MRDDGGCSFRPHAEKLHVRPLDEIPVSPIRSKMHPLGEEEISQILGVHLTQFVLGPKLLELHQGLGHEEATVWGPASVSARGIVVLWQVRDPRRLGILSLVMLVVKCLVITSEGVTTSLLGRDLHKLATVS